MQTFTKQSGVGVAGSLSILMEVFFWDDNIWWTMLQHFTAGFRTNASVQCSGAPWEWIQIGICGWIFECATGYIGVQSCSPQVQLAIGFRTSGADVLVSHWQGADLVPYFAPILVQILACADLGADFPEAPAFLKIFGADSPRCLLWHFGASK